MSQKKYSEQSNYSVNERTIEQDNLLDHLPAILSEPPTAPYTNKLELSPSDLDQGETLGHAIFRVLGLILTHGIAHLKGPQTVWEDLGPEEIDLIQRYLYSFGWQAHINTAPTYPLDPKNVPNAIMPYYLTIRASRIKNKYVHIFFSPAPQL